MIPISLYGIYFFTLCNFLESSLFPWCSLVKGMKLFHIDISLVLAIFLVLLLRYVFPSIFLWYIFLKPLSVKMLHLLDEYQSFLICLHCCPSLCYFFYFPDFFYFTFISSIFFISATLFPRAPVFTFIAAYLCFFDSIKCSFI